MVLLFYYIPDYARLNAFQDHWLNQHKCSFLTNSELRKRQSWCRRRDSNPHVSRHTPLKRACLPISPLRLPFSLVPRTGPACRQVRTRTLISFSRIPYLSRFKKFFTFSRQNPSIKCLPVNNVERSIRLCCLFIARIVLT